MEISYIPPHYHHNRLVRSSPPQRALASTNWRTLPIPPEPTLAHTKQSTTSDNCFGSPHSRGRFERVIEKEDLLPGLILFLPGENDIQRSNVSRTGEAWSGVYNHPVVVRKFGDVKGILIVEFQPLVSFNGQPISESYAEGIESCLKDRRRAMLIEHAHNRTGIRRGAWDNSDCPEKLEFDKAYGETESPTYVRLDKILWIEAEYLLRPFKCTEGCRLDYESVSRLVSKRQSPSDSPLYRACPLVPIFRSQVSQGDLEQLRRHKKAHSDPGARGLGRPPPFCTPGMFRSSRHNREMYTKTNTRGSDTSSGGSQSSTDTELSDGISDLSLFDEEEEANLP